MKTKKLNSRVEAIAARAMDNLAYMYVKPTKGDKPAKRKSCAYNGCCKIITTTNDNDKYCPKHKEMVMEKSKKAMEEELISTEKLVIAP